MTLEDLKNRQNKSETEICELQTLNVVDVSELADLKNNISQFFQNGINIIEKQDVLRIGIVGQMKVGKSSFLNSLFFNGEEILPKAATPMTAGLTVLGYTESAPHLDIEYFTTEEWKVFKTYNEEYEEIKKKIIDDNPNEPEIIIRKLIDAQTTDIQKAAYEMVGKCDTTALGKIGCDIENVAFKDINDLQYVLAEYVGTGGEFTSVVKSITIHLNDDRLRGLQIIDTPGVNDPVSSREMRTRQFLQTCHGVFFLSYSAQFFDAVDVSFLKERIGNQGIATVLMLASKFDVLLLNLRGRFRNDLSSAINQACDTLNRIFNANKAGLNCNNLNIEYDYTSGIGFSIAKKDRKDWDEIEEHIAKEMQKAYPSHFTNEEDLRENFLYLSNFDKIKNDYLDTLFKNHKDEIIAQKISGYFKNNTQNLSFIIDRIQKHINYKIKILENFNQDVRKNIENSDRIFNNLSSKLHRIFVNYMQNLQNRVSQSKDRELKDFLPSFFNQKIPTIQNTFSILHKGLVFGTKHSNFEDQGIDEFRLKHDLEAKIDIFAKELSSFWQTIFIDLREKILNSFSEKLKEVSASTFSNDILMNIFERTLDRLNKYEVLPLINDYKVIDSSNVNNENLTIKGWFSSKEELEKIVDSSVYNANFNIEFPEANKSEVPILLDKKLKEIQKQLKEEIKTSLNAVINRFYDIADNQVKLIIAEIIDLDNNIINYINIEKDKYINQLEKELKNKNGSVKMYETANSKLDELKNLLILNNRYGTSNK